MAHTSSGHMISVIWPTRAFCFPVQYTEQRRAFMRNQEPASVLKFDGLEALGVASKLRAECFEFLDAHFWPFHLCFNVSAQCYYLTSQTTIRAHTHIVRVMSRSAAVFVEYYVALLIIISPKVSVFRTGNLTSRFSLYCVQHVKCHN
eukprot:1385062-Pleurochrysis_carterae.AAC.3